MQLHCNTQDTMQMLGSGFALTTITLGLTQWFATGSRNICQENDSSPNPKLNPTKFVSSYFQKQVGSQTVQMYHP